MSTATKSKTSADEDAAEAKAAAALKAQAEKAEATEDDAPVQRAKQPTRLLQMEHAVMTWHHVAQPGETPDQFYHPSVFAHVARQMLVGHEIVIVAAEGTWRLHLYVRAVGRNEVHTGLIHHSKFGGEAEVTPQDVPYTVSWRGPSVKWSVLTKADNEVVKENFQTQEQANAWLRQHMATLGR